MDINHGMLTHATEHPEQVPPLMLARMQTLLGELMGHAAAGGGFTVLGLNFDVGPGGARKLTLSAEFQVPDDADASDTLVDADEPALPGPQPGPVPVHDPTTAGVGAEPNRLIQWIFPTNGRGAVVLRWIGAAGSGLIPGEEYELAGYVRADDVAVVLTAPVERVYPRPAGFWLDWQHPHFPDWQQPVETWPVFS